MDFRFKRITSATALLLALAIVQLYLPVSLAGANPNANVSASVPQQASAILTTAGNKPISVNGANAISGATILTGAAVETPDQIGATINLPAHYSLEIFPKAKLTMEFDAKGIKVNLIQGCVVLHTKKGTTGEIDTARGVAATADGSRDARLDVCDPSIATAPAAAAGGHTTRNIAIVAGAAALLLIPIVPRGSDPSPPVPTP
jgi:hypothetical protein